jgi:hypothetical protein
MSKKADIEEYFDKKNYSHVYSYRRRLKERLVEYKGGKCEICGYNKCITALEFHHLDPKEKDFGVGASKVLSFEKCKQEVDKCMLVCANCHRELHEREYKKAEEEMLERERIARVEIINNREDYPVHKIKNSYKYLSDSDILNDMENGMPRKDIFRKYHINNKTFNKFLKENNIEYKPKKVALYNPSRDELIELLNNNSKSAIGRMFNVSCSAVIKWCKKYGINA